MINYIKFAIFQIIAFILSIFRLNKYLKFPDKYTMENKFSFLKNQASNSLKLVNINVDVLGRDKIPKEPVLFVINHSSMLDSYILVSNIDRPIGCIIADEPVWKKMPIVNKWASVIRCIYIDRHDNRKGLKSIIEASNAIKDGHSMAVFPEGDLSWVRDPKSLISEFKSGALKIAYKAKCPIVPLVIKNSRETYSGYEPIGKIKSLNVEIEFLDPVYSHIHNPKIKTIDLGESIREDMIDSILEFNDRYTEKAVSI
ncbi:lysophospholipid acyltransferase family protein [Paraclostridium bifermentans]|uniref:lysophospholipid acyltransferase family protein n=1 Tax=Paraclostridium bifermentans TaxID=1490 RepID=UPI00359C65AB